jgi:hypothetical protein
VLVLLRRPFRASVPSVRAEVEHAQRSVSLLFADPKRVEDQRLTLRRVRVAAHIPRMDDLPPAA